MCYPWLYSRKEVKAEAYPSENYKREGKNWRNRMKEMIEEYAGVIAGGAAALAILGMAVEFVLGEAGLYEIILGFSQSIC